MSRAITQRQAAESYAERRGLRPDQAGYWSLVAGVLSGHLIDRDAEAAAAEADLRGQIDVLRLEAEHYKLRAKRAETRLESLESSLRPGYIADTHPVTGVEWGAMGITVDVAMGNDGDGVWGIWLRGVDITELCSLLPADAQHGLERLAAAADDEQAAEWNADLRADRLEAA